jgi:multimeric flavodoxin WrbA
MKITIFNGSPRGKNGNTHLMVEEFSKGARKANAQIENILLVTKKIKYCRGCFNCWLKTPGKCVLHDDMKELLLKFRSSDIVVFATPLYIDNVTGIMKNFMDRLIPLLDPHLLTDTKGECLHTTRFNSPPKIAVISNCGFPEQTHFQVLRLLFKRIARNMHSEIIAEIYRSSGELLSHPPLLLKPLIWQYKKLLNKAGRELAENLKLSAKTLSQMEEPLISPKQYLNGANKYWDKQLSKRYI